MRKNILVILYIKESDKGFMISVYNRLMFCIKHMRIFVYELDNSS